MSYILEALKKAQAERQLGTTPDIHSAPLPASAPAPARAPRLFAYGAGAVIAAAIAAVFLLRPLDQDPAAAGPHGAAAPAAGAASQGIAATAAVPAPLATAAAGAAPLSGTPDPRSVAATAAPAPGAAAAPSPAPRQMAAGPAAAAASASDGPRAAAASAAGPAAVAASRPQLTAGTPSAADPDDALPTARELPDAVRQGLPQPALGGYIYASNPADRLLLVDKTLRHEGEEVAPGLVLERLRPHYAVMNFRGTRYRVAY